MKLGSSRGLRAIALFEAGKGILVLVVGFGLLSAVHRDVQGLAEEIVRRFHLDPARHHPRIFIAAAAHLGNERLRSLAAAALLYAVVRFVEAYGLWRDRLWAEWFAIVSGGIFLPVELYELMRRATVVKGVVLVVNAAVVAYLIHLRGHRSAS